MSFRLKKKANILTSRDILRSSDRIMVIGVLYVQYIIGVQ